MATPIPVWKNLDVGGSPKLQIIDLDKDGLPDIVSGTRNGFIRFFKNIGTGATPSFASAPTITRLGAVDASQVGFPTGFATPVFMSLGNKLVLFCGTESGKIKVYDNIEGKLNDTFRLINGDYGLIKDGGILTLAIANLATNDNKLEIIIGNQRGGLTAYKMSYNIDGTTPTQDLVNQDFAKVYPNPTAHNLTIECDVFMADKTKYIQLFNPLGQCLKADYFSTPQYQFNLSNFARGFYLLKIQDTNGHQQLIKVVKQ